MKLSRAAIAMYMGLVFASGAVLGVFGERLHTATTVIAAKTKNPEEFRKKVVAEMQARLKLSQQQVVKLNTIYDETRVQFEETRQKMKPVYRMIGEEQTSKVRSMLTPDQRVEYEKMHKEREERQKQTGRSPGPGF
jgi:hypothetical protein